MKKLTHRIQRNNQLNDIYVEDENMTKNGVNHVYEIRRGSEQILVGAVTFQFGARDLPDSTAGVIESDLLEIVRHRLQAHQKSQFATRENALALTAVEEALMWQSKRADDRAEDGKLGTDKV